MTATQTTVAPARPRRTRATVATTAYAYAIHTNLATRDEFVACGLASATTADALADQLAAQHHIDRPMGEAIWTVRVWAWPSQTRPSTRQIRNLAETTEVDAIRVTPPATRWGGHAHHQIDWTIPGNQRPDGSQVVFSTCATCRTQMHAIVEHGTFQPRFWRPVHVDLPSAAPGVATIAAADLDLRHLGAAVRSSADRPWTRLIAVQHPHGDTGPVLVLLDSAVPGQLPAAAVLQIRY